jgi:hypothetical protein
VDDTGASVAAIRGEVVLAESRVIDPTATGVVDVDQGETT